MQTMSVGVNSVSQYFGNLCHNSLHRMALLLWSGEVVRLPRSTSLRIDCVKFCFSMDMVPVSFAFSVWARSYTKSCRILWSGLAKATNYWYNLEFNPSTAGPVCKLVVL